MYKVVIVDNEETIRERLLTYLDRLKDHFEVVGNFENGYDCLISLQELQPDLLITDIRMPYVDGIELIKTAKLELPLLQTIIISGYDLFDYAKQAIELGVINYITKPISFEELKTTLLKAEEELNKKLKIDANIENLKKQADSALKIIQENDLNKLITLKEIPSNFKEKLILDQIDLNYKYLILGVFDFDEENELVSYEKNELAQVNLNKFLDGAINSSNKLKDIKFISFNRAIETNILLLSNNKILKEDVLEVFLEIITKINKITNVSMSVGFSEIVQFDKDDDYTKFSFRKLYRHAKRTLEYRTVIGKNIVIFFEDIENNKENNPNNHYKVDENEYKNISYEILYGRIEIAIKKVKYILKRVNSESFKDTYFFIINNLLDSILNSCVSLIDLYSSYMSHLDIVHKIFSLKTNESLTEFFVNLIMKINEINKHVRLSKVDSSFNQIKEYIKNNYKNPLLSLEDIANELNYSLSYISAIFKKNNTSFTKYLTEFRMKKAILLLKKDDNKLINIANEVGYEDPYYFSHCFKKYYGISPLEYRKK